MNPGDLWKFQFSTHTGAGVGDADSLPTGTLVIDGADDAAVVTVADIGSGLYTGSVTIPLDAAAGSCVQVRIAFALGGIAHVLFSPTQFVTVPWTYGAKVGTSYKTVPDLVAALRLRFVNIKTHVSAAMGILRNVAKLESSADSGAGLSWPIDDQANNQMREALTDLASNIFSLINVGSWRYKYVIYAGRPVAYQAATATEAGGAVTITADDGSPFARMVTGGAGAGDKVSVVWVDAEGGTHIEEDLVVDSVVDLVTGGSVTFTGNWRERIANGAFTGAATGWTLGTGWAYGTNAIAATTSDASAKQTVANQASAMEAGCSYHVKFDWTRTAGTLTPKIGDTSGTAISAGASGTFDEVIVAAGTPDFELAGAGFSGTVDNVAIHAADFADNASVVITLEESYE